MDKKEKAAKDRHLIFRRYRRLPNGQMIDAYNYGLKAWPIWINKKD